jgi:hypothetical protein
MRHIHGCIPLTNTTDAVARVDRTSACGSQVHAYLLCYDLLRYAQKTEAPDLPKAKTLTAPFVPLPEPTKSMQPN